jgi:hypothetical protein
MHIAVLFYGRINRFEEHYENIMNSLGKDNSYDIYYSCDDAPQEQIEAFVKLYKPKAYANDPLHITYISGYPVHPCTNMNNMLRHHKNKARVIGLVDTSVKYDVVVSLRLDLVFSTPFQMGDMDENTVYIPEGNDYEPNAINDQVAYGSLETMQKYMNIDLQRIMRNRQCILHPETITLAHLMNSSVKIKRFPLTYVIEKK